MATIPGVSDGELIRTSWGDAVADELNTNTVKHTGNHTMSGTLTLNGLVTANNNIVITDSPSNIAHATRRDYVDGLIGGRVAVAGDTMTGFLHVGAAATAAIHGVTVRTDGAVRATVTTGGAPNSLANLELTRSNSPAENVGGTYATFHRTTSGTLIGSIAIASASSVAYNEVSDPRLKEVTGDAADAADLVQQLGSQAFRGRWIADQGEGAEWVFLSSTDIEAVAPFVVTGTADAIGPGGEIVPQQVNYTALVPLLCAALSQALDRIAALEEGAG